MTGKIERRGTVLPLVSLESSLLTQTPQGLLPITGHSSDQPGPSRHIWLWPCRSRFGKDIHKALAFALELWDLLIFRKGSIMLEFSRPSLIFPPLQGASVRNSTRDNVMRQSSDGKANQTSGFPPGISWASTPQKNKNLSAFPFFWYSLEKVKSGL